MNRRETQYLSPLSHWLMARWGCGLVAGFVLSWQSDSELVSLKATVIP